MILLKRRDFNDTCRDLQLHLMLYSKHRRCVGMYEKHILSHARKTYSYPCHVYMWGWTRDRGSCLINKRGLPTWAPKRERAMKYPTRQVHNGKKKCVVATATTWLSFRRSDCIFNNWIRKQKAVGAAEQREESNPLDVRDSDKWKEVQLFHLFRSQLVLSPFIHEERAF